ncbi:MAG: ferritin [Nitrococcus mobilis]|nr:ferritin [Nitrococcus mobilis]
MAGASATLHESRDDLRAETIERHRAFVSLMEELEAADWYDQRVDATTDEALRAILAHNRDEEKEHAAMVLEWLRRHDPRLDEHLRAYLFSEGSIVDIEAASTEQTGAPKSAAVPADGSLDIGSLRAEVDP